MTFALSLLCSLCFVLTYSTLPDLFILVALLRTLTLPLYLSTSLPLYRLTSKTSLPLTSLPLYLSNLSTSLPLNL